MTEQITDREEQIDQLIAEYVLAEQAGRAPTREAWLAAHPSFAAELAEFLDDRALFASAMRPIRAAITPGTISGDDLPTIGLNASSADTDVPLEPATMIGEYRLIAEIARGGMGVVYKAHHERLNRTVALKMVLPGRLASAADLERFHAEARAAAKLSDPHIVSIYEIGEYRGRPFFSMQFVPGGSLREHAARYRGDARATAKLIATAARAVHHAHQRGILHRDLKPGNILIDEQGEPHVTDFGLAKRLEADEGLTEAGGIVGTPSYMSPEQAGGKSDLTTAVDVWALGAVLYELLTGQPPFRGATPVETMMQAVVQDPPAPRSLDAKIDADLETICMKCLEKEPTRRYGTTAELADDLDRTLAGEPILAKPATLVEQATKWSRRHPLLAGTLSTTGLLAIALLVAAGFSWWNAELRAQAVADLDKAHQERDQVRAEVKTGKELVKEYRAAATKQKEAADEAAKKLDEVLGSLEKVQEQKDAALAQLKAAEELSRRTMYAADMQLAHAAWQSESPSIAFELLSRQQPKDGQADLRGFEWRYLWRLGHGERLNLPMFEQKQQMQMMSGMDVSPDGGTLAVAAPSGKIKIWDLQTGKLMQELDALPDEKPAAIDPNPTNIGVQAVQGKLSPIVGLAWQDAKTLRVTLRKGGMDFLMKRIVPAFMKKEKASLAMVFEQLEAREVSLDGTKPKVVPFDPALMHSPLVTMMAGSCFLANEGEMMTISSLTRSPDGRRLAMCGIAVDPAPGAAQVNAIREGKVVVWDLTEKAIIATYNFPAVGITSAFSPDGRLLAVGSSGSVLLYEPGKAERPRELAGAAGAVQGLAFSSEGSILAASDMSGVVRLWDHAAGKELNVLRGHTSGVNQLAFALGQTGLVTGAMDGELRVWDLAAGRNPLSIGGHHETVATLAFSPDGRELLAADTGGAWAAYDAASGGRLRGGELPKTGSRIAALSPRGSWFAAAAGTGSITVRDLRTGQDQALKSDKLFAIRLLFSPDEKYLAASAVTGELIVWKTGSGEQLPALSGKGPFASGLAFAPQGEVLAVAREGRITLHNLADQTRREIKAERVPGMATLAFSPDGSLLAAGGTGDVRVLEVATGRERVRAATITSEASALALSPDNRRLAVVSHSSSFQGVVRMYDLEGGREVLSLPQPRGFSATLAFSPDGRRLAAATTHAADPTVLHQRGPAPATIQIWEAP